MAPPSAVAVAIMQEKGVQVECNAPVSAVPVQAVCGGAPDASVPTATAAAAAIQAKARMAREEEAVHMAQFRRDTQARLREKRRERKEQAAALEAQQAMRKAEANNAYHKERLAPAAAPLFDSTSSATTPAADAAPSQLDLMRQGLSEQTLGARDLMLTRCELPMPPQQPIPPGGVFTDDFAAYAAGLPADVLAAQAAMAAQAGGSGRRVAVASLNKFGPSKGSSTNIFRSVVSTAAKADRQAAKDAREQKKVEARQALQRVQLAEAVMAEREAAERAAALRSEVAALEAAAIRREEEAAVASVNHAEQMRVQKVVESERFFEGLRQQLRDEVARSKRPLPPLCNCGLEALDNHTEQCARNCIFFNNPAAYGRALSGLFVRPIVLD